VQRRRSFSSQDGRRREDGRAQLWERSKVRVSSWSEAEAGEMLKQDAKMNLTVGTGQKRK
jgi:hypothetical protein